MSEAETHAKAIIALETRFAEAHWPVEETRDRDKTYNKMSRQELDDLAPELPWDVYLEEIGMGEQGEFIIMEQEVTSKKVEVDPKTGKEKVLSEQKKTDKKVDPAKIAAPAPKKDKK